MQRHRYRPLSLFLSGTKMPIQMVSAKGVLGGDGRGEAEALCVCWKDFSGFVGLSSPKPKRALKNSKWSAEQEMSSRKGQGQVERVSQTVTIFMSI